MATTKLVSLATATGTYPAQAVGGESARFTASLVGTYARLSLWGNQAESSPYRIATLELAGNVVKSTADFDLKYDSYYVDVEAVDGLVSAMVASDALPSTPNNYSRPRVAIIGDSLTQYNAGNPRSGTVSRTNGVTTVVATGCAVWKGAAVRVNGIVNPTESQSTAMGLFTVDSAADNNTFTYLQPGLPDIASVACGVANCSAAGDTGYVTWAQMMSGQRAKLVLNAGWSGQRTDQITPRVATELVPRSGEFDEIIVMAGMNDAIQGVEESVFWANLIELWDAVAALNKRVRVCTVTPFDSSYSGTGGAAWTQAKASLIARINRRIRAEADSRQWPLLDFYSVLVDQVAATAGNARAGMLSDGVHFTARGAGECGKVLAAQWELDYPAQSVLPFGRADTYGVDPLSSNIYDGCYTASGGTVNAPATGTVSAGVLVDASGTGVSVVMSTALRADGNGYDQIATVTPGAGAGSVTIRCSATTMLPRVDPAKAYRAVGEATFNNAASYASGTTFDASINATIGGQSKVQGVRPASLGLPIISGPLTTDTGPLPMNGGTPTAISFTFRITFAANAPAFVFKVGGIGVTSD